MAYCATAICSPVHTTPERFQNGFSLRDTLSVFRPHYAGEIWKRNDHKDIKARAHAWGLGLITWLSILYRFRKLPFSKCFPSALSKKAKPAFSNSSGLKSVFEKLCFRDGLVWTVGLTVGINLRLIFKFLQLSCRRGLAFALFASIVFVPFSDTKVLQMHIM